MVSNILNNVWRYGSGERGAQRRYYTDMSKTTCFVSICNKLNVTVKKALASFISSDKNNLF